MKTWKMISAGLLLSAGLFVGGCHGDAIVEEDVAVGPYYDDDVVYIDEAPPEPRVEVISERPGLDFIWIGGFWSWHERWVWTPGCWRHRPYAGSVWVRPSWSHEPNGWRYHHGGWRR